MSDAQDPGVNGSSGAGAVNASNNATSGVTAELKNEIQKVVMGIFKEQVPRAVKASLAEVLPETIKATLGDILPKPENKPAAEGGNAADPEKSTQKARIEALEKQLQQFTQRATEAEARAKDANMRARVQAEIAKYLPADNPDHPAYMGLLYDLQKRFEEKDGAPVVKFKREWGDDHAPLEAGVKELFEGELKHLVQKSKAQGLPPSNGYRPAQGQPMRATQLQQSGLNPLDAELIEAVAKDRPELAAVLAQQAAARNGAAK